MRMTIKGDIDHARRHMSDLQKKQIPFATSLAMNWTANEIRDYQKRRMVIDLDRPTTQTVNSVRVKSASKRKLRASVFLLPWADEYLQFQIEGGRRQPRGRYEALPRNLKLDARGNIGGRWKGRIRKLINQKNTFVEQRGTVLGLWRRRARGKAELLLEFKNRSMQYQARFPFYRYASIESRRRWPANFKKAMQVATSTARKK